MAKRSSALVRLAPRAAAPVIRVSAPRSSPTKKKTKHRRSSGGGKGDITGVGMAAAVLGHLVQSGINIPELPILGPMGTIAVALHYFGPKGKVWKDAAIAAAAIAGYQLGQQGLPALGTSTQQHTNVTHGVQGSVAPQVTGVVANQI